MKKLTLLLGLYSSLSFSEPCLEISNENFKLNSLPEYKSIEYKGDETTQVIEMKTDSGNATSWVKACGFKLDDLHHGGSISEQYFGSSSIGIILLENNTLVRVAITHDTL